MGIKLVEHVLFGKGIEKRKKVSNHAGLWRLAPKNTPVGDRENSLKLDKSISYSRENTVLHNEQFHRRLVGALGHSLCGSRVGTGEIGTAGILDTGGFAHFNPRMGIVGAAIGAGITVPAPWSQGSVW